MNNLTKFNTTDQTILKTIVVLLRNTTWRCGKLERSIVKHLNNRRLIFGKSEVSVKEILHHLDLIGKKNNECINAIKRLEKRNIIRILPL